jgi:uncharacterized protein YaiL (DUF2058 family)
MQNLRDKLLKAGAVSKKEARDARTEARQQRKKGRAGHEQSAAKEEEQRRRFAEKKAEEAREAREREAERARERERHEAEERLRNITEQHLWSRFEGENPFHFVDQHKRVRRIFLGDKTKDELIAGRLGIVAAPYDAERDYRLLKSEGMARLDAEAPERILFWNHPGRSES